MIDNVVLQAHLSRLSEDHKKALVAALSERTRWGFCYFGPEVTAYIPYEQRELGMIQLKHQHFVCGGYLTPLGYDAAKLLSEDDDDDFKL